MRYYNFSGNIGVISIKPQCIIRQKNSYYFLQGILDVGLTDEDMVKLVKTYTFVRKHATGKAKIELHILTVERGLSWEAAKDKWQELIGNPSEEGFYLSHQARNGKKTAILAAASEKSSKYKALVDKSEKGSKKKDKVFIVYRPNTGQQVRSVLLTNGGRVIFPSFPNPLRARKRNYHCLIPRVI